MYWIEYILYSLSTAKLTLQMKSLHIVGAKKSSLRLAPKNEAQVRVQKRKLGLWRWSWRRDVDRRWW